LESYGYYQSGVSVQIDGTALNTPGLADQLSALPKKQDAKIQVKFTWVRCITCATSASTVSCRRRPE